MTDDETRADPDMLHELEDLRHRLEGLTARPGARTAPVALPDGVVSVLVGRVGEEAVAFLLADLEEVVPLPRLARIPEAPPWVAGLLNLRGQMLPVVDVEGRLQRRARELLASDLVLVCRDQGRLVGLVVQAVHDVRTFERSTVQSPPSHLPSAPYLLGVLPWESAPALLLDLRTLIARSEVPEVET